MKIFKKLIETLDKEMEAFENSYKSMSVQQVYNDWYIIGFYNEYYDMLTCNLINQFDSSKDMIEWLATKESPLQYLYDRWTSCDGSFSHNWDDMYDWVQLVYQKEKGLDQIRSFDVTAIDNTIADTEPDIPKDKIMVAILDGGYYAEHHSYPEEYNSEYAHEVYLFDTPEEFRDKLPELNEGDWYWVFSYGFEICSGVIDPADIEIFEEYYGISFDIENESKEEYDINLPVNVTISASTLALDSDDMYRDEDLLANVLSEFLSDKYGFCHKGFDFKVTFNELNEPSDIIVTNIEWDVDDEEVSKGKISLSEQIDSADSIKKQEQSKEDLRNDLRDENII